MLYFRLVGTALTCQISSRSPHCVYQPAGLDGLQSLRPRLYQQVPRPALCFRAQKRQKARTQKYSSFVTVKPERLGAPHYRSEAPCLDVSWAYGGIPAKLTGTSVEVWSKCRMYVETQQWPQPWHYHACPARKESSITWSRVDGTLSTRILRTTKFFPRVLRMKLFAEHILASRGRNYLLTLLEETEARWRKITGAS
jgi:hypothetical protein